MSFDTDKRAFHVNLCTPQGHERVIVHAPSTWDALEIATARHVDVRAASARLATKVDAALEVLSWHDTADMRADAAPVSQLQGQRVDTRELGSLLLSSGAMTGPHRKTRPSLPLRRRIALAFRRLLRGY